MKVSVVIPTHNAGRDADTNIEMLLAQTLPPRDFEVIWVNDGSTDDTPAMLDKLAAEHEHFKVIHIPASGWPGKPRNVGVEAARGEYVMFVDHDDYLNPDALRRIYEAGSKHDADIVLPKQVSYRHPPAATFRENRNNVNIRTFPLFTSLKPHKALRRQFLLDHDIWFDEQPRRMEDGHFVMRAYFAAQNVSIVGDYTCYFHQLREHGSNLVGHGIEAHSYYSDVRDIIEIVEANTEADEELRKQILHRFLRKEMLGRLNDHAVGRYSHEYLAQLVDAQHRFATEKFPREVADRLPPVQRHLATLVYEKDLPGLEAFSAYTRKLTARARVTQVTTQGKQLRLRWNAELYTEDGKPVRYVRDGQVGQVGQDVAFDPELLGGTELSLGTEAKARIFLADRETGEKIALRGRQKLEVVDGESDPRPRARLKGEAIVDPDALADGHWNLTFNLWFFGLERKAQAVTRQEQSTLDELAFRLPEASGARGAEQGGGTQRVVSPFVGPQRRIAVVLAPAPQGGYMPPLVKPAPGSNTLKRPTTSGARILRRAARRLPNGVRRRLRRLVGSPSA